MGGSGGLTGTGDPEGCPRLLFVFLADADASNLRAGQELEFALRGSAITALSAEHGRIVGTIGPAPGVARLRRCIGDGVIYDGLVESVSDDGVRVQVTRR